MPLRRPGIDMKIDLEGLLPDDVAYLYKMPLPQLELLRETIREYEGKGFIEPCFVKYSSSMLFAKKPNRG